MSAPARPGRRQLLAAAGLAALVPLQGCSRSRPLRLGFLGPLSGRTADLGQSARNGVTVAVEQRNRAGGVRDQPVELLVEDDGQDADKARRGFQALQAAQVEAVIGPLTSSMAAAVVPLANAAGLLTVSPTVTSLDFVGKDDAFVRINRTTRDNASDYARVLAARGLRRATLAYDTDNRSFSESWLAEFRRAHQAAGGTLAAALPFESRGDTAFAALAERLLEPQPEVVVLVANVVDSARLAQRLRQQSPQTALAVAEWAATEGLIELGGRLIEGLLILLPFDREHPGAGFRNFVQTYRQRLGAEPGYASVMACDAATVLMDAAERRRDGETLKAALLAHGPYQGLQQAIQFDAYGDTARQAVFTEVRDGRFRKLP